MKEIIETERLYLRALTSNDFNALFTVLSDSDIQQHYPYSFDEERVRLWIEKNINRYHTDGFGLWALCLKNTNDMIGDCGLTLQCIDGEVLPEVGFHLRKDCRLKGFASEAAAAVLDWTFSHTDYDTVYSYCNKTNIPSVRTAEAIGMHFKKGYSDQDSVSKHVSAITREEWRAMKKASVEIKAVTSDNFNPFSLDRFDRFQQVNNIYVLKGGELILHSAPFTDDWTKERKREKATEILGGKYLTFCAYDHCNIIGEIMLVPDLDKNRLIIDSFHVSRAYRRCGIGRRLFDVAKAEAEKRGASAIYLSACSAQETIDFYTALGFLPSPDPIPSYVEDVPCDIQMEYRMPVASI